VGRTRWYPCSAPAVPSPLAPARGASDGEVSPKPRRRGRDVPPPIQASNWSNRSISPDGMPLAIDVFDGRQSDIWVYHWMRDNLSRLTLERSADERPVRTPDGNRIAFRSNRDGAFNLYWQRADRTGDVQRLTRSVFPHRATSRDPTGISSHFRQRLSVLVSHFVGDDVPLTSEAVLHTELHSPRRTCH
jgi:WD40 repeat protein